MGAGVQIVWDQGFVERHRIISVLQRSILYPLNCTVNGFAEFKYIEFNFEPSLMRPSHT